jgi:hypothetical protein
MDTDNAYVKSVNDCSENAKRGSAILGASALAGTAVALSSSSANAQLTVDPVADMATATTGIEGIVNTVAPIAIASISFGIVAMLVKRFAFS